MRNDLARVGRRFLSDVQRDDVTGLAAELAYRFLFAIFPFGIFVAALTAFVAAAIGMADPTGQILGALGDNLPREVDPLVLEYFGLRDRTLCALEERLVGRRIEIESYVTIAAVV